MPHTMIRIVCKAGIIGRRVFGTAATEEWTVWVKDVG